MSDPLINLNINNYSHSNSLAIKLSGKGYIDTFNTSNKYDSNGVGIVLWKNISNKEISFINTSNITSNASNATLQFGINYPEIMD